MTNPATDFTPKPWGGETLLKHTDKYMVKILHLNAGCRTSLQYHRVKRETMIPVSGRAILEIHRNGEVEEHVLVRPEELLPGTVHRLVAASDVEIVEVSSPELDDVVRVADDYGRADSPSANR
jgi:mannose-6-phosphate isomerase